MLLCVIVDAILDKRSAQKHRTSSSVSQRRKQRQVQYVIFPNLRQSREQIMYHKHSHTLAKLR